jgi:hypothetical protein
VTAVKHDLSYREDVFNLPHTKWILLSDLKVFEVRDVGKSGLVIGIAGDGCETMVAYVVSERQCQEIGHRRWNTHLKTLRKAEKVKPTAMRSPVKKPCVFNVYIFMGKEMIPYLVMFPIMLINGKPVLQLRLNVIWVCMIF